MGFRIVRTPSTDITERRQTIGWWGRAPASPQSDATGGSLRSSPATRRGGITQPESRRASKARSWRRTETPAAGRRRRTFTDHRARNHKTRDVRPGVLATAIRADDATGGSLRSSPATRRVTQCWGRAAASLPNPIPSPRALRALRVLRGECVDDRRLNARPESPTASRPLRPSPPPSPRPAPRDSAEATAPCCSDGRCTTTRRRPRSRRRARPPRLRDRRA